MNPVRSSSNSENCVPISSNCVVWQGPDLPCLHLCKGDSVSDVVYKVAVEICNFKTDLGLSDVDIQCLLDVCETTPEPSITLANILQLLVDKVCCLSDIVNNLPSPGNNYVEPTLPLPACLYIPNGTGGFITELKLDEYVQRVASVLCDINSQVIDNTAELANHEERITALENATTPALSVYNCLTSSVEDVQTAVEGIANTLCTYLPVIGTVPDLLVAQTRQCITGANDSLSTGGTMASLPGWNNTVSNLAQSIQNLWITVCDMRQAVLDLKNCCAVDCTQFILGFNTAQDGTRQLITLTFNALTTIPSGFANCPTLSTVVITDEDGHIYSNTLDLVTEATNPSGITYDITTAGFNTATAYTITVTGCITKDGYTCSKTATGYLPAPTTTTSTTTTTTTTAP
jgi:hypothetical protein